MDHSLVSGYIGVVYRSIIYVELVIAEKEAEEVGEAQHGLPVHAVVQVILQQFLLQDHVVPENVFLLVNNRTEIGQAVPSPLPRRLLCCVGHVGIVGATAC